MTKIITANFLIWKSMELHTDSRTKHPVKRAVKNDTKCEHACCACRDTKQIYNPKTDTYHKCRRCVNLTTSNYDWFD